VDIAFTAGGISYVAEAKWETFPDKNKLDGRRGW